MSEQKEFEAMLVANLAWIDRAVGALARRYGMSTDERDDLGSWVKLKLVEEDYRVFRSFRGASSLTTYLTTVIAMLARDYRAQHWGRWRPSASALRQGSLAVRLECLVHRDGLSLSEAGEMLRTRGETSDSDRALAALLATLPNRPPLRPTLVATDHALEVSSPASHVDPVEATEQQKQRENAETALDQAIDTLPPEDRVVVRMIFWNGLSVAEVSRALHLDQRALYRRLTQLYGQLRRRLEAGGVSRDLARELINEPAA